MGNGFAWGQLSHLLAWVFKVTALTPASAFCSMSWSAASGADLSDSAVIVCEGGASISVSGSAGVPGDAHGDHPVGKRLGMQARQHGDYARLGGGHSAATALKGGRLWLMAARRSVEEPPEPPSLPLEPGVLP